MAQNNIFQIFVFFPLLPVQPNWHTSHSFLWGRDAAISRDACEKQSSRRECPYGPGNSFWLSTSYSSQYTWCHQYLTIPIQATGTQKVAWSGREKADRHPASVPPAVTQASRNMARLALLLTDKDACPEPQHSARTKHFSSCLRKSKSIEQKGNLEDYNCAIRVSRENPSRLLWFSQSVSCTHLFVQSSELVFKIYHSKLLSGGEEHFLQDQAVQRGSSARHTSCQDISKMVNCFQICFHPERGGLSPFVLMQPTVL